MLTLIKISAKTLEAAGYAGPRLGSLRGTYWVLKDAEGYCSFDGRTAYMLHGPSGKAAMQSIIDAGGFLPGIKHVATAF
jgi:hypothetical protein